MKDQEIGSLKNDQYSMMHQNKLDFLKRQDQF